MASQSDSSINAAHVPASMPPPPVPIDPALETLSTLDVDLSPGIRAHFLQPGPALYNRHPYPGTPTNFGAILDVQLPAMRQSDLDPHPMSRFQHDQESPWTPPQIGGDLTQPSQAPRYQSSYGPSYLSTNLQSQYREPPRSEQGSSTTGRNPIDSGYGSRSLATKSVRSAEPIDQSQGCQSLIGDVNDMRVYSDEHFAPPMPGHVVSFPSEGSYSYNVPTSEPMEPPAQLLTCEYPECHNHTSKNLSEYRFVHGNIPQVCTN